MIDEFEPRKDEASERVGMGCGDKASRLTMVAGGEVAADGELAGEGEVTAIEMTDECIGSTIEGREFINGLYSNGDATMRRTLISTSNCLN